VTTVLQQREIPETIRALSDLDRVDYVDLFTATVPDATAHSPEEWARATVDGAPVAARFLIWQVVIGLRLESRPSPEHIAGWKIADRGDTWIRMEARSWMVTAQAVFQLEEGRVNFSLFARYEHPAASIIGPAVTFVHRRGAPGLLRHAVRRLSEAAELSS
jgi:hypothetical protein